MDVGAWLHGLGLGQYEQAFRDNAVDAEVLRELTGDDLKELGVTVVGHRRKLLHAIDTLRAVGEVLPSRGARPGSPPHRARPWPLPRPRPSGGSSR